MNHPKFNPWSDSRSEYTPTPDPSPNLGEGGKTGNGVLRVLRTRKTPFPEIIPLPGEEGRRSDYCEAVIREGGWAKTPSSPNIKFGVCHDPQYMGSQLPERAVTS